MSDPIQRTAPLPLLQPDDVLQIEGGLWPAQPLIEASCIDRGIAWPFRTLPAATQPQPTVFISVQIVQSKRPQAERPEAKRPRQAEPDTLLMLAALAIVMLWGGFLLAAVWQVAT